MIYNFNSNIWKASSGIEYAQYYRENMFKNIGAECKFIFTNLPQENLVNYSSTVGYDPNDIIWMNMWFTDQKVAPTTYTLRQLKSTIKSDIAVSRNQNGTLVLDLGDGTYYTVYLLDGTDDIVSAVEIVSRNALIRKDFYSYCRMYSDFFAPKDGVAHCYTRRFYNEDGSVAYDMAYDGGNVVYRIDNKVITNEYDFVSYFVEKLGITYDDIVIIDRPYEIGQPIVEVLKDKNIPLVCVIHADHFSDDIMTDEKNILWNNFYEYPFKLAPYIDYYVCATKVQAELVKKHFKKYNKMNINTVDIPVGSLDKLKYPTEDRIHHSFIAAARLSAEKHIDWCIYAVANAHNEIPDITFDIYGSGDKQKELQAIIDKLGANDYIKLCGQRVLDDVYYHYDAYLSGSTSEGFGLSLMEAIGSGLPIIGFDVRYGNQTFIDNNKNGYLLLYSDSMSEKEKIASLTDAVIKLCKVEDIKEFQNHSYEKAKGFITSEVEKKWEKFLKTIK